MRYDEIALTFATITTPILLGGGLVLPFTAPNTDRFVLLPAQFLLFLVAIIDLWFAVWMSLAGLPAGATALNDLTRLVLIVSSVAITLTIPLPMSLAIEEAIYQLIQRRRRSGGTGRGGGGSSFRPIA